MKDNSGKILLAMLAGASAGVIAGLMMAPDTGEATRTSVKKWAGKVSKDLEKNLQAGLEEIKNKSSEAYNKASSAVDSAKDKANQAYSGSSTGTTGGGTTSGGSSSSGTGSTGSTGGGAGSGTRSTGGGNA